MNKQVSINPDAIESFQQVDKSIEIRFKCGALLKCKLSACVLSSKDSLYVGKEIEFPDAVLTNGKHKIDGRSRCTVCDCLLAEDIAPLKYCWNHAKELEPIFVIIAGLKYLKMSDAEELVRQYALRFNGDITTIKPETAIRQILKEKKR